MRKHFAKIVVASDGHDVLFYVGADENQLPFLHCITQNKDGVQANMGAQFGEGEEDKAYEALARAEVGAADAVRASFNEFMNERFAPSQPGELFSH
jgi:hypothetical protein